LGASTLICFSHFLLVSSFSFLFFPEGRKKRMKEKGNQKKVASAPGHKPLLPTKVYFFFFFKKKCWLEGRFVGELRENGHGRVAKG